MSTAKLEVNTRPTFESAVSILELLPEESQKKVLRFSMELLQNEVKSPFQPKTEVQLMQQINIAMEHLEQGMYEDAEEVEKELMTEFRIEDL